MPDRRDIYYWKCDRAAAFHAIAHTQPAQKIEPLLLEALCESFDDRTISLRPGTGQGNHLTWLARIGGEDAFIRVEDGPERDDYLEVESHVLGEVAHLNVPTPRVLACDATRSRTPFAWQVLEAIPHPDLNQHFKKNMLDFNKIAPQIGAAIARWQSVQPVGFGPFSVETLRRDESLNGFHARYEDYFHLQLDRHLDFLVQRKFISRARADEIRCEIEQHRALLQINRGCLVHKDLALWNILGTPSEIAVFIDFDDTIGGDPMDDLSLLGCFHEGAVIARALDGYQTARPLPDEHRRRFWLHLLRNMIVKAVIRMGAGYFNRSDSFFLIGAGSSGQNLRDFTLTRLDAALNGLREDNSIETL